MFDHAARLIPCPKPSASLAAGPPWTFVCAKFLLHSIEPERRARHLLCAGLVSIELEDANADPDHPDGYGARALRL